MQEKSTANVNAEASIATFLDEGNEPDVGKLPKRYGKINNLAASIKNKGMREVCDKFRGWSSSQIRRFEDQGERRKQMKTGGEMDIADRMYSVSLNRDTSSKQYRKTLSDVTSPMFRVQVRTLTSSLM